MRDSKPISIAAGAGTLLVWGLAYFALSEGKPPFHSEPHEAAGWGIAQQALALLKPGGQIILISRDTAAFKNPASDVQLSSFKKVAQRAGATISSIHLLQVDPLRLVEVPPGDFVQFIRSAAPGSVIVSLMGPPVLNEAQFVKLPENIPPIVAFCPGNLPQQIDLRRIFEQGLLQAAVVSRRGAADSRVVPKDLRGWFDQSFQTIDRSNVGTLLSASEP